MSTQGIPFARWNTNWRYVFLGVILLTAVIGNNYVKRRAELAGSVRPPEPEVKFSANRPRTNRVTGWALERPGSGSEVPMLEVRNLCKYYGNVIALEGITTTVRAGQVTCVLGDNGAGKSSFIKVLAGVHRQSSGDVLIDGEPVSFNSPRDALDRRHRHRVPGLGGRPPDVGVAQLLARRRTEEGHRPTPLDRRAQGQAGRQGRVAQDGHRHP